MPSAEIPSGSDVVVIGGGMLGCWTAYWLASAGVQVTLLEKTAIGWGATGRNGGFLVGGTAMGYRALVDLIGREPAKALQRLTVEGQVLARTVIAAEIIDCDFRQPGTLGLMLGEGAYAAAVAGQQLMAEDGFHRNMLDRQQVQELIRTPLSERIVGGSLAPDGGLLHSSRYLVGIARAAEQRGARLVRAEAQSVVNDGEGIRIESDAGAIRADRVVIALNAWSDSLVPSLAGMVVPTRGQILAYEPISPAFTTALGTDVTPTGEYWQQTPDGSIVIGGCRADAEGADFGVREMVSTPDVTERIESILPGLFPELSGLRVAQRWAGPMAFTSDYLPVADAVPGVPGALVAGGFNGHGMPFGPILGQMLARSVSDGRLPEVLKPLRIDRPSLVATTPVHETSSITA